MRITHVGGPTALIEIGGWRLLTDPTFDAPGRRYGFGWGSSSRKLSWPAIAASDLIRPRIVIPVHYEGWSHFKQGRDAIEREFAAAPDLDLRWLPIGDPVEVA